jgi:radical SAM/Cys-rich protein
MMTAETAAQCLKLLANTPSIHTLDITGGAPELNASFRYLVTMARQLRPDVEIIDRCNLTVLQEPGQEDLLDFLKTHRVRIVASLPCYSESNVDEQRGKGVFERSIAALLALNEAGYGKTPELHLDLVYNPGGAFLPPPQQQLEVQYKKQLADNFGILFNQLFTITNMPIKRFADYLHQRNELAQYMELLVNNFNLDTLDSVMCRDTVSVDYDGRIFDCDFNQQLGYGVMADGDTSAKREIMTVFDLETLIQLEEYPIRVDNHCFGCTAGMGSSCQGTTV